MGFDPVRDAVLNSPHFTHHPLPFPSPQTSPSPDSISFVKQLPLPRSNSLARLLNDDGGNSSSGSSSNADHQLPRSPHSPHIRQPQQQHYFHQPSEPFHHQAAHSSSSPTRPRSAHSSSLSFPPPSQSPLQRPLRSPTTPIQQHSHMPPPPPPALPYNPIRKTNPTSVLRPLTQADLQLFANPTNLLRKNSSNKAPIQTWTAPARESVPAFQGTSSSTVRRGEKRLRENDGPNEHRAAKRAKDQALVAQHCARLPFPVSQWLTTTHR